jgi:hypothetical protein
MLNARQLDPRKLPKSLHMRELQSRASFGLMQRNKNGVHGYGLIRPKRCRTRSMNAARVAVDAFSMP